MPSPAPLMSRAHPRRDLIIDQSPGGLTNQAPAATPFASSFGIYNGTVTSAAGLNDGTNTPWVSNSGGAGQWVELAFPNALHMNIVYLYDRGNPNDQVASGTLSFDDGTVISTGPLNNDGSATAIIFPTILASKIVFAITGVSATTTAVGLTEFQVCYDQKRASSLTSALTTSASDAATDTAGLGAINTVPFSSVLAPPTMTATGPQSASATAAATDITTNHTPIAAIAGGVGGAVVLLIALFLALFLCKRARARSSHAQARAFAEAIDEPKYAIASHGSTASAPAQVQVQVPVLSQFQAQQQYGPQHAAPPGQPVSPYLLYSPSSESPTSALRPEKQRQQQYGHQHGASGSAGVGANVGASMGVGLERVGSPQVEEPPPPQYEALV